MVWENKESSDSEEERHDRFRSERSNKPHVVKSAHTSMNIHMERSRNSNHVKSSSIETRGICARCDYRVESCRCRSTDISSRRHRSDSEDRRGRKRRSSGEEQKEGKYKSVDGPGRNEHKHDAEKSRHDRWSDSRSKDQRDDRHKSSDKSKDRSDKKYLSKKDDEVQTSRHKEEKRESKHKPKDDKSKEDRVSELNKHLIINIKEEIRESKHRAKDDSRSKRDKESNGHSLKRQDNERKKQKKKCKKKLKEKEREENLKKSSGLSGSTHQSEIDPCRDEISIEESVNDNPITDSSSYGPALPAKLQDNEVREDSDDTHLEEQSSEGGQEEEEESAIYGPRLPIPERDDASDSTGEYGPKLPPQRLYGPSLPLSTPHNSKGDNMRATEKREEDGTMMLHSSSDDGGDDVGPVPEGCPLTPSQIQLQHRANLLRLHMENKQGDKIESKREEWMVELPDRQRTNIGAMLAPRSFRTKEVAPVDSSWTDTPKEKAEKLALSQLGIADEKETKEELKQRVSKQRDKDMEKLSGKRSEKSLLEMHQRKLAKKKKKEEKKGVVAERRPFSRETDLSITKLTQAQKQTIYKKAANLDSRFSSGQQSKYL